MTLRSKYLFPLSLAFIGFILSFLYSVDGNSLKPPIVHDEFSYILGADTFLQGRLSNPTPALWQHFETFHSLMTPRYMSKYPPGQSVQLAVGALLGHYLIGVWLTVALIGASLYWLLRSYASPWLSWLVTLAYLILINQFEWGSDYWGGSLLTLAGILVFGGFLRILRNPHFSAPLIIGIGMILMINTRPFEAFLFCFTCVCTVFALVLLKKQFSKKLQFYAAIIVISGLLGVGLTAFYNNQTTGDPLLFPHELYSEQYFNGAPHFTVFKPHEPSEINPMPSDMHNFLVNEIYRVRNISLSSKLLAWLKEPQFCTIDKFFLLSPSFIIIPLLIWRPRYKTNAIILSAVTFLGYYTAIFLSSYELTHYYALWLAPCAFLSTLSIQSLLKAKLPLSKCPRFQTRTGLILIFGAIFLQSAYSLWINVLPHEPHSNATRFNTQFPMEQELLATKDNFICFVQYTDKHNPNLSWIHNKANISEAPVIWARSLGQSADEQLALAYPNREILYFFVNQSKYRLLSAHEFYGPNLPVLKDNPLLP